MPKKIIIALLLVVVLGFAWWLIRPVFFDDVVDEDLEDILLEENNGIGDSGIMAESNEPEILAEEEPNTPVSKEPVVPELSTVSSGSFIGLAGHSMSGTVTVLQKGEEYFVRFEDDFEVDNAPDMFVHFGSGDEYDPEARLAKVKGNKGGQNYEVPNEIDVTAYDEVWVWCRLFSVPMGKAELNP